ncbi:MAG: phosphoribosyltransferase-like protein [Armatimonadota bacterium]
MKNYSSLLDWNIAESNDNNMTDASVATLYEAGHEYLKENIPSEAASLFCSLIHSKTDQTFDESLDIENLKNRAKILYGLAHANDLFDNGQVFPSAELYLSTYDELNRWQHVPQDWGHQDVLRLPELYLCSIYACHTGDFDIPKDRSIEEVFEFIILQSSQVPSWLTSAYVRLLSVNPRRRLLRGIASTRMADALVDKYSRKANLEYKEQSHQVENKVRALYQNLWTETVTRAGHLASESSIAAIQQRRQSFISQLKKLNELFGFDDEAQIVETIPYLLCKMLDECEVGQPELQSQVVSESCTSLLRRCQNNPSLLGCCVLIPIIKTINTVVINYLSTKFAGRRAEIEVPPLSKQYRISKPIDSILVEIPVYNRLGSATALSCQLIIDAAQSSRDWVKVNKWETASVDIPVSVYPQLFWCDLSLLKGAKSVELEYLLTWNNALGQQNSLEGILELSAQRSDIDWECVRTRRPYNLHWISDKGKLCGRKEHLRRLFDDLNGMESCYVTGQKRVGKTSVVRVFESELMRDQSRKTILPIFLEWGDVAGMDTGYIAMQILDRLAQRYMERLGIELPISMPSQEQFAGKLAPLTGFLDRLARLRPDLKVVIIIDEFDEMRPELYRKSSKESDEFFLSLRSIINRQHVSMILVGGERLPFIFAEQGEKLNRVAPLTVDYFDTPDTYEDFEALVKLPSAGVLDFHDNAVQVVYQLTAGNPYFTNVLCGAIYHRMTIDEDSYVSPRDVMRIANEVAHTEGINSFKHFWDDGIDVLGEEREIIAYENAQVLMCLADLSNEIQEYISSSVIKQQLNSIMDAECVQDRLSRLLGRKVLEISSDGNDEKYRLKVGLFHLWLRERGIHEIRSSFPHARTQIAAHARSRSSGVTDEEMQQESRRFLIYQGISISTSDIKTWLAQFGEAYRQRLAYALLKSIKYYHEAEMRLKCRELYRLVVAEAAKADYPIRVSSPKSGPGRVQNVLITPIDAVGKSGGLIAKIIQEENRVLASHNVASIDRLAYNLSRWSERNGRPIIIFVNDFIGTGQQASGDIQNALQILRQKCENIVDKSLICYATIVGFSDGIDRVRETGIPVITVDTLGDCRRAFQAEAGIFQNEDDRSAAKRMCERIGRSLVSADHCLGHEDSQGLVVFWDNTPNNTLPIFHASGMVDGKTWRPLFPRK